MQEPGPYKTDKEQQPPGAVLMLPGGDIYASASPPPGDFDMQPPTSCAKIVQNELVPLGMRFVA